MDKNTPFSDFAFHETLQSALDGLEFKNCTPIQAEAMPHILKGLDVAGLAQTGTGKTAAFLLPMIERILRSDAEEETNAVTASDDSGHSEAPVEASPAVDGESAATEAPVQVAEAGTSDSPEAGGSPPQEAKAEGDAPSVQADSDVALTPNLSDISVRPIKGWKKNNFVLVLVPTRELAEQVKDCAKDFLGDTDQRCVVVYGGVPIEKQISELEKGYTFLVATPGRLIDLYKQHKIDLKQCRAAIFDEADRMFDMGFKDDMKYILRRVPEDRQLLLFSATLNLDVFNVAYQFGSNPVELNVSIDQATAENVDDFIFHLGAQEKPQHLLALFKKLEPKQVIIFTNFKNQVDRISEFLNRNGHAALGISSLINQSQRKKVMNQFRSEEGGNILVATDVAARGLDIKGVDLVINFELPDDAENYVHRIGRTGRAGATGKAYSFVSDKDVEALSRIRTYLGRDVETEWMETEDLPTDFKEFPRGDLFARKKRGDRDRPGGGRGSRDGGGRGEGRGGRRKTSAGGRGGPRRSGSRDERSGGRSRSRHRDEESPAASRSGRASGDEELITKDAAGDSGGKRVHRDKTRGRHRRDGEDSGKKRRRRSGSGDGRKTAAGSEKSAKSKKAGSRRKKQYKSKAFTKQQPSKGGLIQKVGSAFKRMFGG